MTSIWLLLTIGLELPVHLLGLRGRPWPKLVFACVLINGLTHPIASAAVLNWEVNWWLVELAVTLVESLLISLTWHVVWWRALGLSILANGITAAAGWAIGALL